MFVGGTTGEFSSLTFEERLALAARWAALVKGTSLRLVVHVGANCLADAKHLAAHAQTLGAAAIAAVAPNYFKPKSLDVLIQWCAELAAAAPETPFYFYDIPVMTGVAFPMADFLEQASREDSHTRRAEVHQPRPDDLPAVAARGGGRFDVLFGFDEQLLAAVVLGAQGAVGSSYNFAAPLYNRLLGGRERQRLRHCPRGAVSRGGADRSDAEVRISGRPRRNCMRLRGVDLGSVRLPHVPLTTEQTAAFRREIAATGILDAIGAIVSQSRPRQRR